MRASSVDFIPRRPWHGRFCRYCVAPRSPKLALVFSQHMQRKETEHQARYVMKEDLPGWRRRNAIVFHRREGIEVVPHYKKDPQPKDHDGRPSGHHIQAPKPPSYGAEQNHGDHGALLMPWLSVGDGQRGDCHACGDQDNNRPSQERNFSGWQAQHGEPQIRRPVMVAMAWTITDADLPSSTRNRHDLEARQNGPSRKLSEFRAA